MQQTGSKVKANQAQRKYLRERLRSAYNQRRWSARDDSFPEPAKVKAAKKVIDAFEREKHRAQNARNKELDALMQKTDEVILFGNPDAALAAVVAFENREGR